MLFPLKKVSKSNHKYERINQMAAGIILERYGDTLGLDTVNLQGWTKINLPHLNSPLFL